WDTITALGMMVCFYYGVTALASPWYFRKAAFREGFGSIMMKVVLPGLGGILLLIVFVKTTIDAMNPDAGSGSNIAGVGLVGIIGVTVLGLGVILMLVQAKVAPDFFRGKRLARADATTDTSALQVFDDGLGS
ncbi:MAG: amino acid transporter, partial [Actinobacteria bacterium]|nr:amino acid transporter [Actinomycetota bacterium]